MALDPVLVAPQEQEGTEVVLRELIGDGRPASRLDQGARADPCPGFADVRLELGFEEAARGTTATIHVDTEVPCPRCTGAGAIPGPACTDCAGTGFHNRSSGGISIRTECRSCGGAGRAAPTPCGPCRATGTVATTRAVTIRVPAGVADGARLRFNLPDGTGHTTRHAVVRVQPHPYFTRTGNDLEVQLPITIAEAALGATATVPTLDGAVAIRIPPGTSSGRTFRVRRRGIAAPSGTGDLLATVHVVVPTELNDAQRSALEAFAAATASPREHFSRPPR